MRNASDPSQDSSSYLGLLKRLTQRVQQGPSEARILELLQVDFRSALAEERTVLSPPEVNRLVRQVTRAVLEEMIAKIDAQRSDQLPL